MIFITKISLVLATFRWLVELSFIFGPTTGLNLAIVTSLIYFHCHVFPRGFSDSIKYNFLFTKLIYYFDD